MPWKGINPQPTNQPRKNPHTYKKKKKTTTQNGRVINFSTKNIPLLMEELW